MTWSGSWHPIANREGGVGPRAELSRELVDGHPLFAVPVEALGIGGDGDDVLFRLLDGSGRLASVHLTWRSGPETLPFPWTILYEDETDWISRGLADRAD